MGAADGFENMVDALILGQLIDRLDPIAVIAVDSMRGAERLGFGEFVVASRHDDDGGAMRPGDLQAEQSDASRAMHEDRLSGAQSAAFDQREPGRQRRARLRQHQ